MLVTTRKKLEEDMIELIDYQQGILIEAYSLVQSLMSLEDENKRQDTLNRLESVLLEVVFNV